jgi:hypothetical protein
MDSFNCIADGDSAIGTPAQDHVSIAKDDFSTQNTTEPKHDPLLTLFTVGANDRTIDEQQGVWRSAW